jgi:hypothetical protein
MLIDSGDYNESMVNNPNIVVAIKTRAVLQAKEAIRLVN